MLSLLSLFQSPLRVGPWVGRSHLGLKEKRKGGSFPFVVFMIEKC